MQCPFNLNVFGPERIVDERLGRTENYCCAVLARVAIRLQPVAAAERGKKTTVPLVDEFEVGFYRRFNLFRSRECPPDPVDCRSCRVTLSCGRGSLEQRRNLAQLLAEFLLGS